MKLRAFVALLVVLGGILGLQREIDQAREKFGKEVFHPFIPHRADLVKIMVLGYHNLLADAYWLGAIQYFAETSDRKQKPEDLYPMADFITDLDPRYEIAYYFSAVGLTLLNGDSAQVTALLEKGAKHCPKYAPLFVHLGYYYYFETNHPEKAAANYEIAYRLTKNRLFGMLAARIRYEAGSPQQALSFLSELYNQAEDERTRDLYKARIKALRTKLQERELTEAVENFYSRTSRYPKSLGELAAGGLPRDLFVHPLPDHRFVYDVDRHEVRSDPPVFFGVFNRYHPRPDQPRPGIRP